MKVESDALTTLEARFTAEDTKLFRLVAERTLPELPPHASNNESASEARCISSVCKQNSIAMCSQNVMNAAERAMFADPCLGLLFQSARVDAVGPVDRSWLSWVPATSGATQPGKSCREQLLSAAC